MPKARNSSSVSMLNLNFIRQVICFCLVLAVQRILRDKKKVPFYSIDSLLAFRLLVLMPSKENS